MKIFSHSLITSLLVLGAVVPATAQNYLHTNGSQIVDAQGQVVRLTGINWFGLETANYAPHGLWSHSMAFYLDLVKNQGYNCIRLPYCSQLFDAGSTPNGVDANQNPDLVGLSGIQIMDKLIAGCKARGIKVMLDRHRPDSGAQSALWYTGGYSEARWIADWKMLAARYQGDDTVIACDLHNEPHTPSTWGDGSGNDWAAAASRCGNAILSVNPRLLIVVEGTEAYGNLGYWWGGELAGAGAHPVALNVPNQLVHSPHDYPASLYPQTWFSDPSYPANLPSVWDTHWGYLAKSNTAPILIGEFGSRLGTSSDIQWFNALASYIKANNLSFTFWCLNPNSGDTGGLLNDDWTTINQAKQQVLATLQAPFIGGGVVTVPATPASLAAAAGNAQVTLTWGASTGASSYNLYRATTAGGEGSTPVVTGISGTSYTNTGLVNGTTYFFKVAAVNGAGTSAQSSEASATPVNIVVLPPTPAGLAATAGDAQVALSWGASPGAASYSLYRSTTAGGEGTTPVATGITGLSYTSTGLTNGTQYFFKVAAVNSAGSSAQSGEVSATPRSVIVVPPAPTALTAVAGDGLVGLSWGASSGAASYNLYRGTSSGGEGSTPVATGISGTSYSNAGLTNGTTYYFKVAAVNSAGTSAQSGEASAKPAGQGSGSVTVKANPTPGSGPWWGENDLAVTTTAPITALNCIITLQKTTGLSYSGQYNTVGSAIGQSHSDGASSVVYTFSLASGMTLGSGNWLLAAQYGGTGTQHPTSGDTYVLNYTSGGQTFTMNGHF